MLLLWCLSMIQVFSYPLSESSFHVFVDLKQAFVFDSGRLSPHHFEMFAISPQQACAFRCWFSNNSAQFFFARMLSKLICGRSWHFLLHSVIPMIYLLLFLPEALCCCSLHPFNRSVVSSLQVLSSYQVLPLFSTWVLSEILLTHYVIFSIVPEAVCCWFHQVSSHLVKFMFNFFHLQLECCPKYINLITSLSCFNQSSFEFYLVH